MELLNKIFYWLEKIGMYGNAISSIANHSKQELEKIHPELFKSEKIENHETD